MAGEGIRTQLDELLSALKSAGRAMGVHELSSASGLPERDVLKWLHVLEQNNQVKLENRLQGVMATWEGPKSPSSAEIHPPSTQVHVSLKSENNFQRELDIARSREQMAKEEFVRNMPPGVADKAEAQEYKDEGGSPPSHLPSNVPLPYKDPLGGVSKQMEEVSSQLEKVEGMISVLRMQKSLASKLRKKVAEKRMQDEAGQEVKHGAMGGISPPQEVEIKDGSPTAQEEKNADDASPEDGKPPAMTVPPRKEKEGETTSPNQETFFTSSQRLSQTTIPYPSGPIPTVSQELQSTPSEEKELSAAFEHFRSKARGGKKERIPKPLPVHISGVSAQYSERLSRQIKKILGQMQEIDKLRMEKERLLSEHYTPMQRRLESEIDTISERVLRMEKNILGMQERASNLPGKVSSAEKLQVSAINAHAQMRKAYDEATALLEESGNELSGEREKMETLLEQSRGEIAAHKAKTLELEHTLHHIARLEEEAGNKVLDARAALAEQAERLSVAEKHSQELLSLKGEITDSVRAIKGEISNTKGVLSGIEKQMEQMRQVELYVQSIREDYDARMSGLSDYVKSGNEEFAALRESVEANFVRRYLKELREVTESYSFEFNQARNLERSIDERIADEKGKLEQLIEEGKKISQLYESQSKTVSSEQNLEQRGEALAELSALADKRSQIQQMVTQIISGKQPSGGKAPGRRLSISMPKVRRSQLPKTAKGRNKAKTPSKKGGKNLKKPKKHQ